ncbi:MAG: LamG domain-containing protein [Verrucomicrobia bacterium]|nr:LamG domain-containing protein [Verrucomicrobiota bacterium]
MKPSTFLPHWGLAATCLAALPQLASQASDYAKAVLADGPAAYYRLGDSTARGTNHLNSGLTAGVVASQNLGRVHTMPGAIAGDPGRAAFFDFTSRTEIPWNAALNPKNDKPFTLEAWFYPASDQTANGQCPINNRYAYSGVDRQGWVFFQRKPDASYAGGEGVGWNFRMFRGAGSSSGLDVLSGVPYLIGKWTHVVVVHDPKNVVDASVTMYIDGKEAVTKAWTGGSDGTQPGYVANTNDHDPSVAVFGEAGLAIGNYNNTAGTSLNPYFGGVDEFAFYPAKLSAEKILAHYQNATNANRTVSYSSLVKADQPSVYLTLDEEAPGPDIAVNLGENRATGHGTHTAEVRHPAPGAIAAGGTDGSVAYHNRNGNSTTTLPWTARNNPGADKPLSVEFWVRPMKDQQGGQCPANNRFVGGTGRTGWVVFQRNPNPSYPASEGHGWNFRMFRGAGGSGSDVNTETDYRIGEWQHLAFTWKPVTDNGDPGGNGNNQWEGILTAYVNGVAVKTNSSALYAANLETPEDASVAADLGIGAYNAKSGLGNNPFEGNVDEFAIYGDYLLTPEQVLAHYQAGTNAHPAVPYENLVLTAPFTGPERKGPGTYLRFNEGAVSPLANAGSLAASAAGHGVLSSTSATGPRPPAFKGFEAGNAALDLSANKAFGALDDLGGLKLTDRATFSAWIQPGQLAAETSAARIVARGPETASSFLAQIFGQSKEIAARNTNTTEVSLRIESVNGALNYSFGSSESSGAPDLAVERALAPVPAADLAAGQWVQLTGVYDGTHWRLYRNGAEIASAAGAGKALAANGSDWAIGSTGNGWDGAFTGAIDEVAVYPKALSAAQVQAQYAIAIAGGSAEPAKMSIALAGADAVLTWSGGTLQQADSLAGPFTPVAGAVSPLKVAPTAAAKFYRVR